MEKVKKVKVIHDRTGNTLTVWFGDPSDEHICSETGEDVVLMRDINHRVIGFELLELSSPRRPRRILRRGGSIGEDL